ncbi:MAG: SpoIIE family protein phosphatase [Treponema sp.]
MTLNDSFAYIPLFATAICAFVVLVLLIVIYKKKSARVSFVTFIIDALLIISCVVCALLPTPQNTSEKGLFLLSCVLFISAFLFIPYCIILCTFPSKKIQKLEASSSKKVNSEATDSTEQNEIKALSENDVSMLNISKDFMIHASDSFTSEKGMNNLLDYINQTILTTTKSDGSAILMVDDFDDIIAVKSFIGDFPPPYKLPSDMPHKPVRVSTNFKFSSFPLRENIFGEVASSGKPELITKPEQDDRIFQNGPEEFLECGSYIFAPMKVQDSVIGLIALSRKHGNALFTEEDLNNTITLSDFAAAAIKNVITVKDVVEHSELTKEADIACRIQETLHPAKLPVIQGIQIGVMWSPSEGVCGDYYDVIPSRKDRISFVMSDIAGKGTTSMVIMITLRAMLRLVVNTKQSAGTILTWANKGISSDSSSTDHFASCSLINYNSIDKKIEFSTGGTTPVIYYNSATDSISKLSQTSEPIGVEKSTEYKDFMQKVQSGDIIATYTDGLIETLNDKGEQYGKDNLWNIIKQNHNSSGKDIANLVKADIKKFSNVISQHDDQTLLVIKIQ